MSARLFFQIDYKLLLYVSQLALLGTMLVGTLFDCFFFKRRRRSRYPKFRILLIHELRQASGNRCGFIKVGYVAFPDRFKTQSEATQSSYEERAYL